MPKAFVEFLQLPIPGQTLVENREIKVEEYTMQTYSHLLPDLKVETDPAPQHISSYHANAQRQAGLLWMSYVWVPVAACTAPAGFCS
jgi:hypothetical protein